MLLRFSLFIFFFCCLSSPYTVMRSQHISMCDVHTCEVKRDFFSSLFSLSLILCLNGIIIGNNMYLTSVITLGFGTYHNGLECITDKLVYQPSFMELFCYLRAFIGRKCAIRNVIFLLYICRICNHNFIKATLVNDMTMVSSSSSFQSEIQ